MLKYIYFLCFSALFLLSDTVAFAATQNTANTAKPQGMDVYGEVHIPPVAPVQDINTAANPTGQINNQGFQTFQVSPPQSQPSTGAPSLVQPGTGPLATPPAEQPKNIQSQNINQTAPSPAAPPAQRPTAPTSNVPPTTPQPVAPPPQQTSTPFIPQPAPAGLPASPANTPTAPTPPAKPAQADMDKVYLQAAQSFSQGKFQDALDVWQKLANDNHAPTMVALGLLQDKGHSAAQIPVNTKEALTWFRRAADLGHRDGMYHLGRMLIHGRGDAQNKRRPDTAASWFRKAADQGQHDAQYALGVLYENGEGVVADEKQAITWYSLAAAGQSVAAQARLGHFYNTGRAVPKNIARATLLLYGAAMAGNTAAQEELYDMAKEHFSGKMPKVTLFGADLGGEKSITRAAMRAALSVSKVTPTREDKDLICDVYDLSKSVPGAKQMAVCYGGQGSAQNNIATQELGFLKIDYPAKSDADAELIQKMVAQRFGPPTAGEKGQGLLWNLGNVIVATQYMPKNNEIALMYMIPRVYHMTQRKK